MYVAGETKKSARILNKETNVWNILEGTRGLSNELQLSNRRLHQMRMPGMESKSYAKMSKDALGKNTIQEISGTPQQDFHSTLGLEMHHCLNLHTVLITLQAAHSTCLPQKTTVQKDLCSQISQTPLLKLRNFRCQHIMLEVTCFVVNSKSQLWYLSNDLPEAILSKNPRSVKEFLPW